MTAAAGTRAWASRTVPPPLRADAVHVWRAGLALPAGRIEELQRCLSPAERAIASRYRSRQDRDRFVACRGILRRLAAAYFDCQPAEIGIVIGEFGKPEIQGGGLHFNVSHSGALALLGFCRKRPLGVDLEKIEPDADVETLAAHSFSPHELARLHELPAQQRRKAFYACWTRKEAFIKAAGMGLRFPLDRFDVSLEPGAPARLLRLHGSRGLAAQWTLADLPPLLGYAAALAMPGGRIELSCFNYRPGRRARAGTAG